MALIQPYSSRFKSIRYQLSLESWKWGLGTFFTENIPFSFKSGILYANQLASLYTQHILSNNISKDRYYVHEFGSGLGFLSKHFLDRVQILNPELYKKTIITLVDISETAISKLKTLSLWDTHKDHVQFHIDNAIYPTFKHPPIFVFSSNFLDTIPPYHIDITNSRISEIVVQSSFSKDSWILDTTTSEPQILYEKDILPLLTKAEHKEKRTVLAHRITACIDEQFKRIPIEESAIDKNVLNELQLFCKTLETTEKSLQFNYSPELGQHIKHILNSLEDDGLYAISDFGFSTKVRPVQDNYLMSNYGTTLFASICFPYVNWITKQHHSKAFITKRELDQTQDLLLYKGTKTNSVKALFRKTLNNLSFKYLSDHLEILTNETPEKYLSTLNRITTNLDTSDTKDYYFLKIILMHLFSDNHIPQAKKYAQTLINEYKELAIDGHLVYGWIEQKEHNQKKAINAFKKVLDICPNHTLAWASQAMSHLLSKNDKEALSCFKKALFYSKTLDIWQYILAMAKIESRLGNTTKADSYFSIPFRLQKEKTIVPDYVTDIFIKEQTVHTSK